MLPTAPALWRRVNFADDDHECLRLLLDHAADVRGIARMALAAPISTGDVEGVRLLLEAGADPGRYHDDDGSPAAIVYTAVHAGCAAELVELLLAQGAQPDAPGPDGRSPYALAVSLGRSDVADLLRGHGADDDATDVDRLVFACLRGDVAAARSHVARDPALLGRLTESPAATAMITAAEHGNSDAVTLMLDIGFPAEARGEDGGTPLHAAAFSGSVAAIRVLLDHGADIESRDTTWQSTPLEWAIVGSGSRPATDPDADWVAAVQLLIDAGASTDDITLSADDPKPPSSAVAEFLQRRGIGGTG